MSLSKESFSDSTKGERLLALRNVEKFRSKIPPLVILEGEMELSHIDVTSQCGPGPFAVRSSSKSEDGLTSNAGAFDSFLNVSLAELDATVEGVRSSYGPSDGNQVIIQAMVVDVQLAGVLFTLDPNSGARYFCIEWDPSSETDSVTSGRKNHPSSILSPIFLGHEQGQNEKFRGLIELTQALINHTSLQDLDVEFALDFGGKWHILQVRPLHSRSASSEKHASHSTSVDQALSYLRKAPLTSAEFPSLGERALSKMADWNPAELIGDKPDSLSFSLFRSLISDNIWAYERSNYGYTNMRSFPLVVDICGQPFVDLHVSAISLLPSVIPESLTCDIVNFQVNHLRQNPEIHDKVEFELYLSEYSPKVLQRISSQIADKKDRHLVSNSLAKLTRNIVLSGFTSSHQKSMRLSGRFKRLMASQMGTLGKLYWLIEDTRRFGTLPFGGVARSAFIATSILRGLFDDHLEHKRDVFEQFMGSLSSPAKQLGIDQKVLSREELEAAYGHLRPGTFHNTAKTYRESGLFGFRAGDEFYTETPSLGTQQIEDQARTDALLAKLIDGTHFLSALKIDAQDFVAFARRSIQGREWLKFEFSKNISASIDLVNEIGANHGYSPEDLSYAEIDVFTRTAFSDEPLAPRLQASIELGRSKAEQDKLTLLPQVIFQAGDLYSFTLFPSDANFITSGSTVGEICVVDMRTRPSGLKIENKVVFIESADPGFDWVFSHRIAGLVTAFGGANSHMAIRCQELALPAVIGLGPQQFHELIRASSGRVFIDASRKIIEPL